MEFVGNSIIFPAWISLIFQFFLSAVCNAAEIRNKQIIGSCDCGFISACFVVCQFYN